MNKNIKYELQHIFQTEGQDSPNALIRTIASYLRRGSPASKVVTSDKHDRKKETEYLITFIDQNQLWVEKIDVNLFISEGAEQRVYIKNEKYVYKLNDGIYYASWLDYFHNLLLNNYFFPDTAYELVGFYKDGSNLYALVEQPFVKANQPTDLDKVRAFMEANGFMNTRNHDYFNPDLGVILEDLHDENVLTQNDILYFIDTVFYLKPEIFWA